MKKEISVDDAIAKGKKMMIDPTLFIMIWIPIIFICIAFLFDLFLFWFLPLVCLVCYGLSWLYWSLMVTRWRLWAFDKVKNVHELKRQAVENHLIYVDGHKYEKTEIRTAKQEQKWKILQKKFEQTDIHTVKEFDDLSVPQETRVYYSKSINFVEMGTMLLVVLLGTGVILDGVINGFDFEEHFIDYVFMGVMMVFATYFGYKHYKKATNRKVQIILNEKGMQTISTQFYTWDEIENEKVINYGDTEKGMYYLVYDHPKGREDLETTKYNLIDNEEFQKLFVIYRHRHRNAKR